MRLPESDTRFFSSRRFSWSSVEPFFEEVQHFIPPPPVTQRLHTRSLSFLKTRTGVYEIPYNLIFFPKLIFLNLDFLPRNFRPFPYMIFFTTALILRKMLLLHLSLSSRVKFFPRAMIFPSPLHDFIYKELYKPQTRKKVIWPSYLLFLTYRPACLISFYCLLIKIIDFYFPFFYYCLMTSAGSNVA